MTELYFWEIAYANEGSPVRGDVAPDAPFMALDLHTFHKCVASIVQGDTKSILASVLGSVEVNFGRADCFDLIETLYGFLGRTQGACHGHRVRMYDYINGLDCNAKDLFYYVHTMLELAEYVMAHRDCIIRYNSYELMDDEAL